MTDSTHIHATALPARLEQLASEAAEAEGCQLVDLELASEAGGRLIRVFLDRVEGGLQIVHCEAVSDRLSGLLDLHDLMPGRYRLEVSSPGLTRPLKKREDFVRFAGRLAVIHAALEPLPGEGMEEKNAEAGAPAGGTNSRKPARGANRRSYRGTLSGMDGEEVLLRVGENEQRIPFRLIGKAHLDFDF
ncbi:MAG: ribosome maturation factor RimP [Magnetococcus sp. YQC-9]